MKRWVLLLILLGIHFSVQAQTIASPHILARYFPADTLYYASMRTDQVFIDELDRQNTALTTRLEEFYAEFLPAATLTPIPPSTFSPTTPFGNPLGATNLFSSVVPATTLQGQLDMFAQQLFQGDFATTIRPWLGDTAAIGVLNLDFLADFFAPPTTTELNTFPQFSVPLMLVAQITNRAQAEAVFQARPDQFTRSTDFLFDFTVFDIAENKDWTVYIGDDVLIMEFAYLGTDILIPTATLENTPHFQETINMLPEDRYDTLAYVNLRQAAVDFMELTQQNAAATHSPMFARDMLLLNALAQFSGSLASGSVTLEGRVQIADMALNFNNPMLLKDMGFVFDGSATPLSPDFWRYIPANAGIVVQIKDMGHALNSQMFNIALLGAMGSADNDLQNNTALRDEMLASANQLIAPYGTTLADIWALLDGETALFVTYALDPETLTQDDLANSMLKALDFGFVTDVQDVTRAQTVFNAFTRAAPLAVSATRQPFAQEQIGDAQALVFTLNTTPNQTREIIVAMNNQVFVVGTRAAVQAVLAGNSTFGSAPDYLEARQYMLSDAVMTGYVNRSGFQLFMDQSVLMSLAIQQSFGSITAGLNDQPTPTPLSPETIFEQTRTQLRLLRQITNYFGSGTWSSKPIGSDGDALLRTVNIVNYDF